MSSEFSFQPEIESLDNVPEGFKSLYEQGEKGFKINSRLAGRFQSLQEEAISNTKKALQQEVAKEQKIRLELEKQLNAQQAQQAQAQAQAQAQTQTKKEEKKNEGGDKEAFERRVQEMLEQKNNAISQLQNQILSKTLDNALKEAIHSESGSVDLLEPILKQFIKASLDDSGNLKTEVQSLDGEGVLLQGNGTQGTLKDLVKQAKKDERFARAFSVESNSGGQTIPLRNNTTNVQARYKPEGKTLEARTRNLINTLAQQQA